MIDRGFAEAFAAEWIAASPFIVERMGEPSGRLRGKAAIRPYWGPAVAKGEIRFTLEEVLVGVDALTILYRRETGQRVAETIAFDAARRGVRGAAHYGARP